jgi:hypothetical protein
VRPPRRAPRPPPHELFDATSVVDEYTRLSVGNREFTNLPRLPR